MNNLLERIFNQTKINQLYEQLEKSRLELNKYCLPFIPYVPKNYQDCRIRILYVGKATNGWGPDKTSLLDAIHDRTTFSELVEITDDFMECCKNYYCGKEGYGRSRFMQRIYVISSSILGCVKKYGEYRREEEIANNVFSSFAWTNVFKIGGSEGNPDYSMIEILTTSFNTLEEEIELLNPHLIIFSTGKAYDIYLREIFNSFLKFNYVSDGIEEIIGLPNKFKAYRTVHFQVLYNTQLCQLCKVAKKELNL